MATNTTSTISKTKTNTNTNTVRDESPVDEPIIDVGTMRVPYSELERTIAKVGYWNILQIIVEPSYGGAYFVVLYVKK